MLTHANSLAFRHNDQNIHQFPENITVSKWKWYRDFRLSFFDKLQKSLLYQGPFPEICSCPAIPTHEYVFHSCNFVNINRFQNASISLRFQNVGTSYSPTCLVSCFLSKPTRQWLLRAFKYWGRRVARVSHVHSYPVYNKFVRINNNSSPYEVSLASCLQINGAATKQTCASNGGDLQLAPRPGHINGKQAMWSLPFPARGVLGSKLGLAGTESSYSDWGCKQVWSAAFISVWQHARLFKQVFLWLPFVNEGCSACNQPTNTLCKRKNPLKNPPRLHCGSFRQQRPTLYPNLFSHTLPSEGTEQSDHKSPPATGSLPSSFVQASTEDDSVAKIFQRLPVTQPTVHIVGPGPWTTLVKNGRK